MPKPYLLLDADHAAVAADAIKDYVRERAGGEIESVCCRKTSKGLFLAVEGQAQTRRLYEFFELAGSSELDFETDEPPPGDRVYTVEQLLALRLPEPPAIIEGFLHEGETIVLAGRQKVGKSRFTQQMALCMAMNVPRPVSVLMIDLENRLAPLSQRFRTMAGSRNGDKRLSVWCAQSLDSTLPDATPDGSERLQRLVEAVRPDVLIIDPWRLWMGGDENDAREVVKGLKVLAAVRRALPNLAIIIVHHVRKEKFESPKRLLQDPSLWADAVSGHHALMSHVDACYGLERQMDDDENRLIVFGGIARNAEPRTLVLEEDETLRFQVASGEVAALNVMTKSETAIWMVAKQKGTFRFNQLVTAANTKNRKAVSKALDIAVAHGLLHKIGEQYRVVE